MRRFLLLLLALVVIAVIAGLVLLRGARDETTTVGAEDAAELVGATSADDQIEPGLRPAAGAYEYVGGGSESLSLLGGSSHEFPERVTGVVQLDPDDECAWSLGLVLVAEHVEERRYCTTDTGTLDAGFDRTTEFLGREQTSSYECDDAALRLRSNAKPGDTWSWTCTEARGGLVRFTATYVGSEAVDVDGTSTDTAHIRITARQRDKSTGDERGDWWLLASGLPARIRSDRTLTTDAGPLGDLKTIEQFEYRLASLEPTPVDEG
jgi:hypothetical protein